MISQDLMGWILKEKQDRLKNGLPCNTLLVNKHVFRQITACGVERYFLNSPVSFMGMKVEVENRPLFGIK